ncbi:single-stranded-DNA-specific exonuclease RecJ [Anaplasma phagocytophilum]|uniref:Single-stranded-DNA-specific exonuclease RecJ n=1 Tax=Anaplasma phagocytophilum TaxID=948 RepID=A0A098EGF7_ANAPH|nr:single-stranded-DNA-specific exonuclease RecJ [Anaplasma phagocytophilum]CEG20862.1 Single-stranded-DNA-specific exonuclease RecJ [Anaplasma phagocytophilum]
MLQSSAEEAVLCTGVSGAVWKVHNATYRDVLTIKQKFGLSEIVAHVLAIKRIPLDDIRDFLFPTLKLLLPDPFHLLDMGKAVDRILKAIYEKERIVIFGDYDVDGATSSAMLKRYFESIGATAEVYIPDRLKEGYGPNPEALIKLRKKGCSLCITVDCGTVAHEPISVARAAGLDVIVVDHHIGSPTLPDATAIINPNRLDETSTYTYLSGVGTSFMLLIALNKTLRQAGYFQQENEPNLMNYLDLVALGTVCDVMPMLKLNRAFVKQGLKVMSERGNMGLRTLADAIGIEEKPSVYHLGFCIGPHINAGGRIGNSSLGARLLSSNDAIECNKIVTMLLDLNNERKEIENRSLAEALAQAELLVDEGKNIIMVTGNWHVGVIGIIAGRIKERFFLPTIVISLDGDMGKASARSVAGIDIGAAVLSAKFEKLIPEGGGHEMAAGFSVHRSQIGPLYKFFLERFKDVNIQKALHASGILSTAGISSALCRELQLLEPFGPGNPEPKFVLRNVRIKNPAIIGESHIKCLIDDGSGAAVRGMCFKCVGTELALGLLQGGIAVHLLGKVSMNQWRGNEYVQFIIDDLAFA